MIVSIVLTSSVWRVRATSAAGGRTTATPSRRTTRTSSGLKQMPATSRPGNQRSSPASCRRPEYARAVMLANPAMISPGKLDNFLSVRRERQSRLEDGTGVRLDAVVWEAALLTTVGDTSIQKAQLEHLADLTKRPNISVQVLPLEAGDHASMSGSFVLFSFGRGQVGGLWVDDAVVRLPRSRFSRSRLPFQSPLRHRGALLYLTRRGVLNIKRGSCCANSL